MRLLKRVTIKKLLGVNLNNGLEFDTYVTNVFNQLACFSKNFTIHEH